MGRRTGKIIVFFAVCITMISWCVGWCGCGTAHSAETRSSSQFEEYAGSWSCNECHERFYKLWRPSHHGMAMQPYTADFSGKNLAPQKKDIIIGQYRYRARIGRKQGYVLERGPHGKKKYSIEHVMGGKNIYYFLTPMEKGRLQVLPVAYDINKKEWYDTAGSGVRHFVDMTDEALDWKHQAFTFNTMCYNCHVSQLSTNYDLDKDTYNTVWAEPGINCETCHGPSLEHNRVCKEAPEGYVPKDLKIISYKKFSGEQIDTTCAPCHAKMIPISTTFMPGDTYFDHYDLVTLEDPDFYPDGRDLGENYTYTLWRMSPCVKSGMLNCLHCHTSSGRWRQKNDPNQSCSPCHLNNVKQYGAHSRHPEGEKSPTCISCHMPMTEFARMKRSDHSMLPPTPQATIVFGSPNACNICHKDKNAHWADNHVRQWRKRNYQEPILYRASLVNAARKQDWSRLPDMLNYIIGKDRDEVFATSLIRLLKSCEDGHKWPALIQALKDPSPLIRAAAAESLSYPMPSQAVPALLEATRDRYRLVRVRAAAALSGTPRHLFKKKDRKAYDDAFAELEAVMKARPDDYASYFNMGNIYMKLGEHDRAINHYETAIRLQPEFIPALINESLVYDRMGMDEKTEASLRKVLEIDPDSEAANLNLGLLLGEQGRTQEAEKSLRAVLKTNPRSAVAAYNLGVLLADNRPIEAMEWCLKAFEWNPNPRYGYTLAFFMRKNGDEKPAASLLELVVKQWPEYVDTYLLLGDIYERQGKIKKAEDTYRDGLKNGTLSGRDRFRLEAKLRSLH